MGELSPLHPYSGLMYINFQKKNSSYELSVAGLNVFFPPDGIFDTVNKRYVYLKYTHVVIYSEDGFR